MINHITSHYKRLPFAVIQTCYVHFVNEWGLCLPTGPELRNGHMGGFLNQRKLKGDALAQQSTESLLEEFGQQDALCINAILHGILFNMNKSLIYLLCVHLFCKMPAIQTL